MAKTVKRTSPKRSATKSERPVVYRGIKILRYSDGGGPLLLRPFATRYGRSPSTRVANDRTAELAAFKAVFINCPRYDGFKPGS